MTYSLRYARPEEFAAVADLDGASFGFTYSEQDLADALLDVDPATMLVAWEGDAVIGVSCEVPLEFTVPGGASLRATGLTWVSVEATRRRQGVLRALVEQQVRDTAAKGVPALVLTASEGGIYGRFGFGVATQVRKVVVDRRAARLAHPLADHGVRRVRPDEARRLLPDRYDRWRQLVPGALARDATRWQLQLLDREWQRDGMSALFHLVHDDGYVSYRIRPDWNDGHPRHTCWLTDYVAATPQAHAGLWQVLLGLDLCATVESYRVPVDDALPYLLTDPRVVRTTTLNDGLWLRPLDVPALLAARTYSVELEVVLGVRDPLLGDASYRVRGGPDGARCERTDAPPDVRLGVGELGALTLGGVRVAPLFRAGLIRSGDPGLLTRLDRAFLGDVAPSHGTQF